MRILVNDKPKDISTAIVTVADLLAQMNIPVAGTAVALNGKLVKQPSWGTTNLSEGDDLTIISAAYGG